MAKIVEELEVRADTGQAEAKVKSLGGSMEKSFFTAQLAVQAFNKTISVASDYIKEGIGAALDWEKTTIKLKTALEVQGREIEKNTAAFDKQSARLEAMTGVSDEVFRSMQAQAVMLGANTEEARNMTQAAAALSNVIDRDIKTSFDVLVRSMSGVRDRTLATIPAFRDLSVEQLKSGEAITVTNREYSKFIDLTTKGTAGQITQLTTSWANLQEEIGKAALAVFDFKDGGNWLIKNVKKLEQGAKVLAQAFRNLASGMGVQQAIQSAVLGSAQGAGYGSGNQKGITLGEITGGAPERRGGLTGGARAGGRGQRAVDFSGFTGEGFEVINPEDRFTRIADMENRIYDMKYELRTTHLERMAQIEESERQQREDHYQQMTDTERRALQMQTDIAVQITSAMVSTSLDLMEAWADGADINMQEVAKNFLRGIGRQLLGQGIAHGLTAAAKMAILPGDPQAIELASVAALEMGIGGAMWSGSLVLGMGGGSGGSGSIGSGPGGGSGGRAPSGAGSVAEIDAGDPFAVGGPTGTAGLYLTGTEKRSGQSFGGNVVVNVNGPVLDSVSFGVMANKAIGAARAHGMA